MNEVDENGWAHIHHASKKGYFKSVEKFVKNTEGQLEFETEDELRETPLLVATRAGIANIETINILIDCGGNLQAKNTLNHGIVEICCMEGHTAVLEHFIKLGHEDVPVWEKILKLVSSSSEEESAAAGNSLSDLTKPDADGTVNDYWKRVFDHGAIPILVKVIKSSIGDKAKAASLQCIINILTQRQVKEQLVANSGIEILIKRLTAKTGLVVQRTSQALSILCTVMKYADQASNQGAIPVLVNVLSTPHEPEVLVEVLNALGVICDKNEPRQTLLNSTANSIKNIASLLQEAVNPNLLLALNNCISRITRHHEVNQNSIADAGIMPTIISLCNINNKDIQLSAVDTIHMVVDDNNYTQKYVMQEGAIGPLMTLLRRSKVQIFQEKTASALWALAGSGAEDRRAMAARIEVNQLIEFLGSLSETLKYIGSEGLGVLAQGAHNRQDEIADANGVYPLVRVLKEDKEYLVVSAIRSIRHLCLSVGYIPHKRNQSTTAQARGLKTLIALMTLSKSELIQVEAALTLASISLGNAEVLEELWSGSQALEFSYVRILKLLYSEDAVVRLLAGGALATFAFNNMTQQQAIAAEGGVRFSCFLDFLQSDDEFFRCNAAFQVIVLSRVIPDEEQAVVSAAGIKLISDVLHESRSPVIQALAADCVARLAHTRAGIPAALVAIGIVERLCDLMLSDHPQVRGCTAIALAYLSFNHKAERELLNRCRVDPYLIKCLFYYADKSRISPQFLHEWKHYKKIGLPPIQEGRPTLVSQQGYRISTTMPKPSDGPTRLSNSKSNALHGSNNSLSHSQHHEDADAVSTRASVYERANSNAADRVSDRSHSRAVTVAE